jgi:hypothetical protein
MRCIHRTAVLLVLALAMLTFISPNPAGAAGAAAIDRDATKALNQLLAKTPVAAELAKAAKGILVFPSIV